MEDQMSFARKLSSIVLFVCIALVGAASAQDAEAPVGWNTALTADFTTTQTAYSDSWTGGEAGSFNWVTNINGTAEKALSSKCNFRSALKVSFGQTMSQYEDEATNQMKWKKPAKSTDLIDWENVGRFTLHKYVDPFIAFRVETQFLDASHADKNLYLSPMRFTESVGIARKFYANENDQVLSRFGVALRQTMTKSIIDDDLNTESVTETDGGFESVTDVVLTVNERMKYTGKLTVYKTLTYSKKDDFVGQEAEDYWKAIDINWENIVNAQLSKIIAVNFYTQILYDKQLELRARFKETLGIGFVFKLM